MKTILLVAALFLSVLTTTVPAQIPGGFSDRSKTDENAVAAAKFAVSAHDPKLQFQAIEKVESQVVAGINYRMTISVLENGKARRADVVVWRKLDQTYKLTLWEWSGSGGAK